MGFEKTEIKLGSFREVGVLVEQSLDVAEKELQQYEGARQAFVKHGTEGSGLPSILMFAEKELEKEIPDLETLKLVKKYIMRCIHSTQNQAQNFANLKQQKLGEIRAFEAVHTQLQALSETEKGKVRKIQEALESGDLEEEDGRPISLKARRLAEEAQEKQDKEQLNLVKQDKSKKPIKKTPVVKL